MLPRLEVLVRRFATAGGDRWRKRFVAQAAPRRNPRHYAKTAESEALGSPSIRRFESARGLWKRMSNGHPSGWPFVHLLAGLPAVAPASAPLRAVQPVVVRQNSATMNAP
jgi:hypothetical protein